MEYMELPRNESRGADPITSEEYQEIATELKQLLIQKEAATKGGLVDVIPGIEERIADVTAYINKYEEENGITPSVLVEIYSKPDPTQTELDLQPHSQASMDDGRFENPDGPTVFRKY